MLRSIARLLPLTVAVSLIACQDQQGIVAPEQSGGGLSGGEGKGFTLLLTDAPGDFLAAVVTIAQVRLQGDGSSVDLLAAPYTGNLLDLQNEVTTLVQGVELPAGSYSQLRLVLSGAYLEVETTGGSMIYASSPDYDGLPPGAVVAGSLQMPSMGQSGLKVDLPGGRIDIGEGETIVMLDFDAAESFGHQAGNSGKWVMHPVIKASNVTFGGGVVAQLQLADGVVLPDVDGEPLTLADFGAELAPAAGGAPIEAALTDTDGDAVFQAAFRGLPAGDYLLGFVAPAGLLVSFAPTLPVPVTVVERQTSTQLVTVSTATLPGSITATLTLGAGVTLPSIGTPPAAVTLGQFKAQLTPAGGTAVEVTFTDANTDGTFEAAFPGLAPGDYSLTLLNPAGVNVTYDVTVPVAITLASGAAETRPFVITTATVPAP